MLALVVTYFGWAFIAMDYFRNDPDGGVEAQLLVELDPSAPESPRASSAMPSRLDLPLIILIAVVEAIVVVLWIVMRKLERERRAEGDRPGGTGPDFTTMRDIFWNRAERAER